MMTERFKPKIDKLFYIISVPTVILMAVMTALSFEALVAIIVTVICDIFVVYLFISPLFGCVELREETVFIKYGLFLKREIPYAKIRTLEAVRHSWYSDSMLSLKNSFDHVNIKYNKFDITSVSVIENGELIKEIEKRIKK